MRCSLSFRPLYGFAAFLASLAMAPAMAETPMVPLARIAPAPHPAEMEFFDGKTIMPLEGLAQGAKATFVHFWATWCAPCIVELPELSRLAGEQEKAGLRVLAISLDGDMDAARMFLKEKEIRHVTLLFDQGMHGLRELGGRGLPVTVIVKDGKMVARADGPVDWNAPATRALLAELLSAPQPSPE